MDREINELNFSFEFNEDVLNSMCDLDLRQTQNISCHYKSQVTHQENFINDKCDGEKSKVNMDTSFELLDMDSALVSLEENSAVNTQISKGI